MSKSEKTSLDFLLRNACRSRFNLVAFPLRKNRLEVFTPAEYCKLDKNIEVHTPHGVLRDIFDKEDWLFNPAFLLKSFEDLIEETPGLILIESETDAKIGLAIQHCATNFNLGAVLHPYEAKIEIMSFWPGYNFRSPQSYEIIMAGAMNTFSALGFTKMDVSAYGRDIALLARMGFAARHKDDLYQQIRQQAGCHPDKGNPVSRLLNECYEDDVEDLLADWGREMEMDDPCEREETLSGLSACMTFDTENNLQVKRLIQAKSCFPETRPPRVLQGIQARNSISKAP